jgi:hypothetical protein
MYVGKQKLENSCARNLKASKEVNVAGKDSKGSSWFFSVCSGKCRASVLK